MSKTVPFIEQLTLEEKAALLEGVDSWNTNPIPRLNIPSLFLTDGPHGLRKVRSASSGFSISNNEVSTSFPTSATVAASWDPNLAYQMGRAIADECLTSGVDILLAPGVNIKRSPLCGRNFEYYSEDPLVSGIFGEAFTNGVQSKGIGVSVKHFAVNSNEQFRFIGDSIIDSRALREIYLKAFERIVKRSNPYTVMCSYNKINGTFASQNKTLLTDILREEWGFEGLVMTDWGATSDRILGIRAGCDLDMPGGVLHNRTQIIDSISKGTLDMKLLDQTVSNVLNLVDKCQNKVKLATYNQEKHSKLSCDIAKESAILLKNDGVLPLKSSETFLVVGEMFEKLKFQGAGSSLINPHQVISPKNAFDNRNIQYHYEKGYQCFYKERALELETSAIQMAKNFETILFFGGLTDFEESEGFDREHMRLGDNQVELLNALIQTGKKVILILFTGAPVELPFIQGLSAVLDMVLPGMYGGEATAALLFGETNPSGKLAESWPIRAEDTSCSCDFGKGNISNYYESIYVGYRYYDKANTKLLFPFGYGLSYTTFEYQNFRVNHSASQVTVRLEVTNTGGYKGSEIVQLYVRNNFSDVFKADKELRAFTKINLDKGETKTVTLNFELSDLSYWNCKTNQWVLENGVYAVMIGSSAQDIKWTQSFEVQTGISVDSPYSSDVSKDYQYPPKQIPDSFRSLVGIDKIVFDRSEPISIESSLSEIKTRFWGKILYRFVMATVEKDYKRALNMPDSLERDTQLKNTHFVVRLMPTNSLRSMAMASNGAFPYQFAQGFAALSNGRLIKGLRYFLVPQKKIPLPRDKKGI